ncbi:DUF3426 domain-containing protein [Iodobacter fluviatilis]|uniref:Zinc finger/thioredoxin putative domain-containing protein n=1 Tax=Iodobacter fluviatilis TaxID=537 RepID=A0A7G3G5Z1_9NEIS|nr:DUF3426 domain-containing protein [Iodobacter fluviatilis]QBC42562.1 hypothetical protein C1H71_02660 [Iodobacter fluviatilis]
MAGSVYQVRASNMNDITRCPNCQTAFRVTEAQLAAHRGKVRCGRCAFVFNAKDSLKSDPLTEKVNSIPTTTKEASLVLPHSVVVETPQVKPHIASPKPQPIAEPVASTAEPKVDNVAIAIQNLAADIQYEAIPATDSHTPSAKIAKPVPQQAAPALPKKTPKPVTPPVSKEPVPQQAAPALPKEAPKPVTPPVSKEPSSYRPIYMDDDNLLAPAPAHSKWHSVYIAAIVLLMLGFALQLAYHQRTQISMELPWLRPKLISACQALGCSMPLPKNTEMLRSEWSELSYVPEFPNIIQLNATLRNLAQYEQALPMLEVTLTDDQEHIVLKKVFKPSEYLSSHDKKRLQFDAQDELRAFLQIDLGELHSTAYSIYWFYP